MKKLLINRSLGRILLGWAILLTSLAAGAADEKATGLTADGVLKTLDHIERELRNEDIPIGTLEKYLKSVPEYRNWALECLQTRQDELHNLQKNLEALGEFSKGEPDDVTRKRKSLKKAIADNETSQASCKLVLLRSEEDFNRIDELRQSYLAEKYFIKGPSFATLIKENWENPGIWLSATHDFILNNSGIDKLTVGEIILLISLLAAAFAAGIVLSKWLRQWTTAHPAGESRSSQLLFALAQTLMHYAAYLLPALTAALFFYMTTREVKPVPFISIVAYGLPLVTLLLAMIHVFLNSSLKFRLIKGHPLISRKLGQRLKILVLIMFLGYLLFSTILAQSLPEQALLLTRPIYGIFIIINLIMVIWLVGRFDHERNNLLFRFIASAFLIGSWVTELYGYRNLSAYIFQTTFGTLVVLAIFRLFSIFSNELIDAIETGRSLWKKKLHNLLGIRTDQPIPGMVWIRITVSLFLWFLLIASLVYIWKVPNTYVQTASNYITSGFNIGSVNIQPLRILQAILLLPVLLAINAWFRKGLEKRWLMRTQMERGARESMATITGYVGVGIAIIISLSVAGMDFSKLALIAGALSVGIGFGLQNIVNNFVSGLILLFERPIKTGDWIEVGSVVGYVRRISIRSTQIQTFDRADVIVPNSDLIAGTVTNWMLYDQRGRIRVPVGVAYGSNTARVKELLLQVAEQHEQVIRNPMLAPEPMVLFLQFGNSSLDFELRCHIKNIDTRVSTISEMNFAIDALFRENGIEIPFPQRDLHIRDIAQNESDDKRLPKQQDTASKDQGNDTDGPKQD